ncbi:MAG: DUF5050 domain-containing protein [Oscillospiraceae bacterium]|nr:DUF5050 domain-containing protein [Oscillospiraceae bacterium]
MGALEEYAQQLLDEGTITYYSLEDNAIYMEYASMLTCVLSVPEEGTLSNASDLETSLLFPFDFCLPDFLPYMDNGLAEILDEWGNVSISSFWDDENSVESFLNLNVDDLFIILTHGCYVSELGSVLCTGETVTNVNLLYYMDLLLQKNLTIYDGGYFAITPRFVSEFFPAMDGALVIVNACQSGKDSSLVSAFLSRGAEAVITYSDNVNMWYSYMVTYFTLRYMDGEGEDSLYHTVEEAFELAQSAIGYNCNEPSYSELILDNMDESQNVYEMVEGYYQYSLVSLHSCETVPILTLRSDTNSENYTLYAGVEGEITFSDDVSESDKEDILSSVTVRLMTEDGEIADEAKPDENGVFYNNKIEPGDYTMTLYLDGERVSESVDVEITDHRYTAISLEYAEAVPQNESVQFSTFAIYDDTVYVPEGYESFVSGKKQHEGLPDVLVDKGSDDTLVTEFCFYGDRIYYLLEGYAGEGACCWIYSCDLNGENDELIVDDVAGYATAFIVDNVLYYEGYEYYWDEDLGYEWWKDAIYKVELSDLSSKEQLAESGPYDFGGVNWLALCYCDGDWLYYESGSGYYKMDINGANAESVSGALDEFSNGIYSKAKIYGEKTYYIESGTLYEKDRNGGNAVGVYDIVDDDAFILSVTDEYIYYCMYYKYVYAIGRFDTGISPVTTELTAYASVVRQYEETYGAIGYNVYYQNQEAQTGETYMLTGLCLVQPIDFDGDSVYELLIGYGETSDASTGLTEVHGDVWGLDGDTPVLLYSGASFPGESYYNAIAYKNEDGVYYLYDGYSENRFAHIDIYCLTDGSFTKVYTLEADFPDDSPTYTLNGAAISMSEYAGYVSDGLTEFYAQVSSLEAFETCQDDLISVFSQMGLQ